MRSLLYIILARSRYRLSRLFRRQTHDLTSASACWAPMFGRRSGLDLEAMAMGEPIENAPLSARALPQATLCSNPKCAVLFIPTAGYVDDKSRGLCSTCRWEEDMSDIVGSRTRVASPVIRKPCANPKVTSVNRRRAS